MLQIKENVSNEIIVKGSRFICFLYNVNSIDDVNYILEKIKKLHKEATHVCYAYRLENSQKYNDDGEPGGTAGAPIMSVLEKNCLTNILAVVVRYFGGTKLGAGGLIRAYSKATREALSLTDTEELIFYDYYEFTSSYDDLKLLNTITKDLDVVKKDFKSNIIYTVKIEKGTNDLELLVKNSDIKIQKCS